MVRANEDADQSKRGEGQGARTKVWRRPEGRLQRVAGAGARLRAPAACGWRWSLAEGACNVWLALVLSDLLGG